MQKLSVVLLMLALCAASSYGYESRTLLRSSSSHARSGGSSSGGGSSSSGVRVTSTGGRSRGSASGSSRAYSKAKSSLIHYCEHIHNQYVFPVFTGDRRKYCYDAYTLIKREVIAYGSVSASAFSGTVADVEVEGDGTACAYSNADAESSGRAYAKVVGEAIASAKIGRFRSKAKASFNIVSDLLAQAYTESYSKACAKKKGFANAYHSAHAKAYGKPIAAVWVWLFADVDCRNEGVYDEVFVEAESTVQTTTGASSSDSQDSSSDAHASSGGVGASTANARCKGHIKRTCCSRSHRRRRRCRAEQDEIFPNVYYDRNGKGCTCK